MLKRLLALSLLWTYGCGGGSRGPASSNAAAVPTPTPIPTPREPSLLNFDVAANVSAAELELIKQGIDLGRVYLADRLGGDIPSAERSRLTVKVVATGLGNPSPNAFGSGCTGMDDSSGVKSGIFLDVLHSCWNQSPSYNSANDRENHKLHVAAHEYTHLWDNRLGCLARTSPNGPYMDLEKWMVEGIAEFVGSQALMPFRLDADNVRRFQVRNAVATGQANESLWTLEYLRVPSAIWPGHSGYLAIEQLASRAPEGVMSIRRHCEAWAGGASREEAFLRAFGISKAEYYAAFPAYLAELRARYGY